MDCCHISVTVAYGPTFDATVGRQNHVEMMNLCWVLEGVFHKKFWVVSSHFCKGGKFLSPT